MISPRAFPLPYRSPTRRPIAALLALLLLVACTTDQLTDTTTVASIALTPPTATVETGRTVPLAAQPRDENGAPVTNRPIAWSSSNTQIATVSTAGIVTARAAGEARIAASAGGQSATATITVTERDVASVQVQPVALSVRVNRTAQLVARPLDAENAPLAGRPVTWSSSDPAVATVSSSGLVSAVTPGAATITATSEGRSGQSAVTVTPDPVATVFIAPTRDTLAVGADRALIATVQTDDGTVLTDRPIGWSVNNASVASVSSAGVVTALAPGTTTVLAVSEGRVGQATIVVVARLADGIIVTPGTATLPVGSALTLLIQITDPNGNLLTDRPVSFTSDNPIAASVTTAGMVTALQPGVARITAQSEGKSTVATITVIPIAVGSVLIMPASGDVLVNSSRLLTVEARSASGELLTGRTVTWTTGSPAIATISSAGLLTGVSPGATVVAATIDGVTAFASITVRAIVVGSVTISPLAPDLLVNGNVQLVATTRDAGGLVLTDRTVTWTSSNEAVAFISSTGRVVGVSAGTAVITATAEGVSATTTVTVR